ncbi:uncharacterized protein EV420DRAFT_309306 [Desarmillaria tabescens]|uniref:F-box domain-containing protein n=1 Tax=Armillaria tabescens TaxID=1929756 RepID=A0AA39N6L7_ARMTA|nr:uncharacterized protein EV420DRAFT_309306 [Desarmillaria tabescens]KAK0459215.1 hypothetical protein EV420DRAFT_309306 [Desarmillaria tabescens]
MSTLDWTPCKGCSCPNHHFPPQNIVSENISTTTVDLTHLIRSNDQPLPAEIDAIQGIISQHEERIATTDLRVSTFGGFRQEMANLVSKIDEMIAALLEERKRVLVEMQEKKSLLSAVRRLPPEILSHIFRETIEFPIKLTQLDREVFWWNFNPVQCSLWAIALVSRLWRTVALDFPELWSYVNIMIKKEDFAEGEYSLIRRLGLQLSRSQQSLLSLCICDDGTAPLSYEKLPSSLELLLFSVSDRLRELYLGMAAEVFSAIPPLQLRLPSLEILSVLCTNALEISNYDDLQLICHAPKLRDLTFIDVEDPAGSFEMPWTQITRCSISCACNKNDNPGPDPVRLLEVLELMTNLTSYDLVCEAYSLELGAERVACAKLQDFALMSWPSDEAIPQLFDRLLLPSLSVFRAKCSVGSRRPDVEDAFRSIQNAINVSHSPLTILEFEHGLIAEEDLLSILRTTPTLELLKLVDVGPNAITDQTLDELTVKPSSPPIVPRLSSLHLSTKPRFTSQTFVAMIGSRRGPENGSLGVESLKSVTICWFTDEDTPDENETLEIIMFNLSSLDMHRLEGFEFVLTTQKNPQRQ